MSFKYPLLFIFILFCQLTPVSAQPSFALNGSSIILSENCYQLTSHNTSNDVGSLWCEFPVELENMVDFRFAINLGCSKYAGEGIAFVMHTDTTDLGALGCHGSVLGFGANNNCDPIKPSLALEIDTRFNRSHKDLYQPHLTLVQDGNITSPLIEPVRAKTDGNDVRDCEYHNIRIVWIPSKLELSIYFDGELRITYKKDIVEDVFDGSREIYFGFTGSTGKRPNMQTVCVQSLKMELDGEFEQNRIFEESVGIYPNPLKEKLTIDVNFSDEEEVQMQLYDSAGKLIYEIPTHFTKSKKYYFNMPGLPSGIYYVTVTNGINRVSKKIVHLSTIRA